VRQKSHCTKMVVLHWASARLVRNALLPALRSAWAYLSIIHWKKWPKKKKSQLI